MCVCARAGILAGQPKAKEALVSSLLSLSFFSGTLSTLFLSCLQIKKDKQSEERTMMKV